MKRATLIIAIAVASAVPASAATITFDFYKLSGNPAQAGDFPSINGYFLGGTQDRVNDIGSTLDFENGGLTLRASGTYNGNAAAVVQDHESAWTATRGAGLGVYKVLQGTAGFSTSDDNITLGETLTITSDQPIRIERIELRAEGHDISWDFEPATFLLNGTQTVLPEGVGSIVPVNLTGTEFSFAFDGASQTGDQFYLASLTVSTVPEGGPTLGLFGLALAGIGMIRRRLARRTR